jgi:hypothetical protein
VPVCSKKSVAPKVSLPSASSCRGSRVALCSETHHRPNSHPRPRPNSHTRLRGLPSHTAAGSHLHRLRLLHVSLRIQIHPRRPAALAGGASGEDSCGKSLAVSRCCGGEDPRDEVDQHCGDEVAEAPAPAENWAWVMLVVLLQPRPSRRALPLPRLRRCQHRPQPSLHSASPPLLRAALRVRPRAKITAKKLWRHELSSAATSYLHLQRRLVLQHCRRGA